MGGRRGIASRDPDVAALVEWAGGLLDPKTLVINEARRLLRQYRLWNSGASSPIERVKQLASLRGFTVSPMDVRHEQRRAALMFRNTGKPGGQIFYNPALSKGRIAFSIAHEIVHDFFPITGSGARFREMLDEDQEEMSELELLCHAGAAELLMPCDEFQAAAEPEWSIGKVPFLMNSFGGSFEATVFRLASAYPGIAAAGLLCFRRTKGGEAKLSSIRIAGQRRLFDLDLSVSSIVVETPKYRRQSFHSSIPLPRSQWVPFNKSFDPTSCVYRTENGMVSTGYEALPVDAGIQGRLEAVDAPYQRESCDPDHPDVLFFWRAA